MGAVPQEQLMQKHDKQLLRHELEQGAIRPPPPGEGQKETWRRRNDLGMMMSSICPSLQACCSPCAAFAAPLTHRLMYCLPL